MLKFSLVVCAMVVLTGCPGDGPDAGQTKPADSPIIVSDGSPTHLKHKGPAKDFDITSSGGGTTITATVSDGYTVKSLECVGFSNCSSAIPLIAGWSLVAYDGQNGTGNMILTIGSTDNQTVIAVINSTDVYSKADATTDTSGGTDLIQPNNKLASASLTNNSATTSLTCAASPCKLKIHYY
jgi:hypothetical protein